MSKLRNKIPVRTCKKIYSGKNGYRRYKDYLAEDFNNRCGYCDESDLWSNGKKGFQIDHFAPKKKEMFPFHGEDNLHLLCS